MDVLKKYWVAIVAVLILFWLMTRKAEAATSDIAPDGDGFPNEERATAHFTWNELFSRISPKFGKPITRSVLGGLDSQETVAIARFMELVRALNGGLPVKVSIEQVDSSTWGADATPLPGESLKGLSNAAADAVANLSNYPGAVSFTSAPDKLRFFGDSEELVKAVAAGAAKV